MNYSDKEILQAIRSGEDDKALSALYKNLLPKIKSLIRQNGGGQDDALDIFQDAILIFYKQVKMNSFNEAYSIAGFVYTISRNLWINQVKRKKRSIEITDSQIPLELDDNMLTQLMTKEREDLVVKLLSSLGETCHRLLTYVIFHRLSMKEISQKMEFSSEDVAKTKHYKCKQRLIQLVKNTPYTQEILRG
ncbi:sigma-70 family RNA polymerase sigma factor [Cytophagaceae bacterium YF14B1]|uniref:Sigma-70 family RNA polymerase sigma factor n=1 Tax=Xanthocytophaga flava TaxID=3048013 RepID=A0AAE3U730_9BACT|nr:sigma-70 family RNA polymerase sigma factor [Xanthocytophaga flavus]MDJ1482489.1 sigma-70 family RNA polymerase sigma factor [Xanthocytophaga flavus]